jgi:hypothetical protein
LFSVPAKRDNDDRAARHRNGGAGFGQGGRGRQEVAVVSRFKKLGRFQRWDRCYDFKNIFAEKTKLNHAKI